MRTILSYLVTADVDSLENPENLQFTAMQRCYEPSTYDAFSDRFCRLLPIKFHKNFNECALRGVTCEDHSVKRIKLRQTHPQSLINAHWMPSSTEVVHLTQVSLLNGWRPETLPRSLKYFYVLGCKSLPLLVDVDKEAAVNAGKEILKRTRLRNLPQNLEEMYAINSGYAGGVCIQGLPRSLRILVLKDRPRDIYIDFDEMPAGLEKIFVDTILGTANLRVHAIGKRKYDPRVKLGYLRPEMTELLLQSVYYRELENTK